MTYVKKKNGKKIKEEKNPTLDKMQTILNKKKVAVLQDQKKRRMS